MTTEAYKKAIEQAASELQNALRERDYWTLEVSRLEQLIKSLSATGESRAGKSDTQQSPDEVGLQEVVHTCIRMSPAPLGAIDVRQHLESIGYDLAKYANPLAVIHGAIARLNDAGKIAEAGDSKYRALTLGEMLLRIGTDYKRPPLVIARERDAALRASLERRQKKDNKK